VLVIGYGNPGRLDDGLGPAVAAALEELRVPGVVVAADYQLMVEDAAVVAEHDVVIFADADASGPEPFSFQRIEPSSAVSFTSHSVSPSALLALARDLFGAETRGYVLGVRGYEFNEFGERLSPKARTNLDAALAFIERVLREGSFDDAAERAGKRPVAAATTSCEDG